MDDLQAYTRDGERLWASADRRTVHLAIPVSPRLSGGRTRFVAADGRALPSPPKIDLALVRALRSAHAWAERLGEEDAPPVSSRYERSLIRLSCLAPDIQAAILAGEQPGGLILQKLITANLPLDWGEQRALLRRL